MSHVALVASDILAIPARRGFGRLLSGMWEGDPVSWSIFGGVVVIAGVVFVVKMRSGE
ncbi:MAG: hypothetical protein M3552_21940 [Planctomycetota bacterium]|nr:hypothetical protein [Planctomycetaceae bacterium]MDQ3333274.1 hypothetical protein [Planctomycetota bacterium]